MKRSPKRTADRSFLVRCTAEQRATIDEACRQLQAELPPYSKVTANSFILHATLEKARAVLDGRDTLDARAAASRGRSSNTAKEGS